MKRIPLKIFIVVLLAGIVGISGEILLIRNVNRLSYHYQVIVEEHDTNRIYMTKISSLAYRHQSVVAKHLIAEDSEHYVRYEADCLRIQEQLMDELSQFGVRMTGEQREQLYHNLYSDLNSYMNNADVALELSREGNKSTAFYYYDAVMNEFLEKVAVSITELDDFTVEKMHEAKEKMDASIRDSAITGAVCVVCIIVSVVVCLVYSVKITYGLDRYKDNLEREVKAQTEALQRHSEKMLSIQDNTIIGMANLIESRDGDTGGHIKRTSSYVKILANAAKEAGYHAEILTDDYIELLVKAAPMHDIGKIAVPDSILKKPGKFTKEEYEQMKCHAAEGGRIVREVLGNIEEVEFVEIAEQIAAGHHEKWDGTGYPRGQKGEEIPLCARIMAVADVFDALVSKRCYKEPMSADEAFTVIAQSAGTHFDARLTALFLKRRSEVETVMKES